MMTVLVIIIVIRELASAIATTGFLERNGNDVKPTKRHTGIPGWYECMMILMVAVFMKKREKLYSYSSSCSCMSKSVAPRGTDYQQSINVNINLILSVIINQQF